jgi:hypothetical protein
MVERSDRVFDICSSATPTRGGRPDAPTWLKKDRAYQIAAAHFYALDFAEAIDVSNRSRLMMNRFGGDQPIT